MTLKNLLAGVNILSKYDEEPEVCAGHDVLLVSIKEDVISEEDVAELKKHSWWYSTDHDGWGFFP